MHHRAHVDSIAALERTWCKGGAANDERRPALINLVNYQGMRLFVRQVVPSPQVKGVSWNQVILLAHRHAFRAEHLSDINSFKRRSQYRNIRLLVVLASSNTRGRLLWHVVVHHWDV